MKYKKIGQYDYEKDKPVLGQYRGKFDVVERKTKPRAGAVLGRCKCGGEIVVVSVDGSDLVCGCTQATKCGGGVQYWEVVAEKATKKAA